jgi:hypothetical protein
MANLLIGVPRIPRDAAVTCSRTADSMYPFTNLFGGNKTDLFYTASAATGDTRLAFDLGSGNTAAASFLYIGRANLLQQSGVTTITLRGHSANDYNAATTVRTISSFNAETLYGPNQDDYIAKFTQSSAFRYWWVNYNSPSVSSKFPHAKLFFGTLFDPGRDPNAPATITRVKEGGVKYRSSFSFQISWEGISYSNAITMYLEMYRTRRFTPLVIFTDTWHDILMGHRVIFCRLTEMQMPPRVTDFCDISATFEEIP